MAGSTSLPSVVAVFPPSGLRATGSRALYWTPSLSRSCRHTGVRILWGGILSVQCCGYGVVRALEKTSTTTTTTTTTKASPKSRRRVKKPVEEVPGAEPGLDQVSEAEIPPRRSSGTGRKKKVLELEDLTAPRRSSGTRRKKKVLEAEDLTGNQKEVVENTEEVSSNEESSEDLSNVKPGARRRRRSAAKKSGAETSESNTISKQLQVEDTEVAQEISHSEVESPEKHSAPSVSRSRRKKKTAAVDQPTESKVTTEDASVDFRNLENLTTEGISSSSSAISKDERMHRLGISEEQPSESSDSTVEPDRSNKSARPRKRRVKLDGNVKLSEDEELKIRVRETSVTSLNGSVQVHEGGTIPEEIAREGHGPGLTAAEPDIHITDAKVKTKRLRKARKKPVAVADSDEGILDKVAVAQSVLLEDTSGTDSGEDVAVNSNLGDSVLHSPRSEESSPPKTRRRRRRPGDAIKEVSEGSDRPSGSTAAPVNNIFSIASSVNGGAGDTPEAGTLWESTQEEGVEEVAASTRIQFPAPTWGPQWWDEIQSKSQATISFQDIAERREGFQARSKVSQEPVPQYGEVIDVQEPAETSAEVIESVEQRIEVTEANLDVLNRGDAVIRRRDGLKKSGRRIAKIQPAQKLSLESYDEWLKKKMLSLGKPTEEPWLLESMIAAEAEQELSGDVRFAAKQEVNEVPATSEEPRRVFSSSQDTGDLKKEPEVEVEILINTSECTMQRMAILENKKLVEFSIEPVNTKVQVGNVYLGRVKQLLPGMSGVFADIGGSRLALLDIARNQYPYTFPPVHASKNSSSNNSDNGASLEDEDPGLSEEDMDFIEEEDDGDEDEGSHHELLKNIEADGVGEEAEDYHMQVQKEELKTVPKAWRPHKHGGPITVNFGRKFSKWRNVEVGMPIIVQVKKEAMGKKGPRLTAFPTLAGRFWVLIPRGNTVGVSARITGPERRRLKLLAQSLRPQDLGITVRTEAIGHEQEELERDLTRLIDTWKEITEKAAAAALALERGEEAAVPVLLHREMGQTLTIIRDLFTEKISRLVVDSSQSYQEVINYLQEVAPHLMSRVVLYSGKVPIFDKFNVEVDLDRFSSERVELPSGGYLVMQETEALVSIDVNGGAGMLGHSTRQREAILEVNLAAAKQIASEIRLRDIGGIIVVDFIDMHFAEDERLVHEEMRKAIQRDRSKVSICEISEFGLMEMTRKRVRSSVTLTIHSPCSSCKGTGHVEAFETTLSKIERAIRRLLAEHPDVEEQRSSDASTWPQVLLRVEPFMLEFLKSWKKKRIVQLGQSLRVWISLKAGMELSCGQFEVTHRVNKKASSGSSHGSPKSRSLQQEKAVTAPVLGKRVWPKRKRHYA